MIRWGFGRYGSGLVLLTFSLLMALVVACGGAVTPTLTATPAPSPTPTLTSTPKVSPTATLTPSPIAQPRELFLRVLAPEDNIVVPSSRLVVQGLTSPDATVSVNGLLVMPLSEGSFETTLTLDEGLNLIEVLTSDVAGNRKNTVLTVIYIP